MRKTIGQRLRSHREAQGWTQRQLGQKCGVHPSVVALVELDKRQPGAGVIIRLCRGLRISADWLLGLERRRAA